MHEGLAAGLETPGLFVAQGVRGEEQHFSAVGEREQLLAGGDRRGHLAESAPAPRHLAGRAVDADEVLVLAVPVQMAADGDRRGKVDAHLPVEPDLDRFDPGTIGDDPLALETGGVAGERDRVVAEDGSEHVAVRAGLERHPPQRCAGLDRDREQAVTGRRDDLPSTGERACHERRIGGEVVLGLPRQLAGPLVERAEAGAVRAADRDDDAVALDDRGAGVPAPARGTGTAALVRDPDHPEIGEMEAPTGRSVGEREATELAATGLHVHPVAIDQRSTARAGLELVGETLSDRHGPQLLAGRGVKTPSRLLAGGIVEEQQLAGGDDRSGVAVADRLAPYRGRLRRKLRGERFRRDAVAGRTAPLRPIGGRRRAA